METAVERARIPSSLPAVDAAADRPSLGGDVVVAVVTVLLAFAVLVGGGSSDRRLFWIGVAATLSACGILLASYAGFTARPRLTRAGWGLLASFAGLVLLTALSIRWSLVPDRSWAYANRGFVYGMFLVLGVLAGGLVRRAPRAVAMGFVLVFAATIAWALAGKIAPGVFAEGARLSRLRSPIGYWNALSLLCAMTLPLALWIAAAGELRRAVRALGAVLFYAAVVGSLLTYSRGGIVVGAAAVVLWLALAPGRVESIAAIAIAGPFALAVSAWAFRLPGIVDDFQEYDVRVGDGRQFGIVLAVCGLLVWALFDQVLRRGLVERAGNWWQAGPGRAVTPRRLAAGAALVLALAVLVAVVGARGWLRDQVREFESPTSVQVGQDPSRLGDLSTNNRWTWWQQAWDAFEADPWRGTGAATFELVNLKTRENSLSTTEPHNVPLQFLSELGIGGLGLLVAVIVCGILAVRQGLRRLTGPDRAAGVALAVGIVAYLVHWLVDKDWEYVAVTAPVLVAAGTLAATGLEPLRRRNLAAGVAIVALAWAGLYSLTAPELSSRLVDRTYGLIGADFASRAERVEQMEEAVRISDRARGLNPYSLEAIFANASALDVIGFETQAHVALYDGMRLQPENPRAWYELGSFEFEGQRNNAFNHLDRAYRLDPYGPAGPKLDELRAIFAAEKEKCLAAGTC